MKRGAGILIDRAAKESQSLMVLKMIINAGPEGISHNLMQFSCMRYAVKLIVGAPANPIIFDVDYRDPCAYGGAPPLPPPPPPLLLHASYYCYIAERVHTAKNTACVCSQVRTQ
jgi:hypothetical protein